jgi:hypothetical protein
MCNRVSTKFLQQCKPIGELIFSLHCKAPKDLQRGTREPEHMQRALAALRNGRVGLNAPSSAQRVTSFVFKKTLECEG